MFQDHELLSIRSLVRKFPVQISVTWGLTLVETGLFAFLPLAVGWAIDGLLADSWFAFRCLIGILLLLLIVAFGRRVYDTRAYGTIRVELGKAQTQRAGDQSISIVNARILMGRELVDFLETEAPIALTSLIQVIAALIVLLLFHGTLALAAGLSVVLTLSIYALFARRFYDINRRLNEQSEKQITALESRCPKSIAAHFLGLRRHEVKLSDTESLVYGSIFAILMTMLAFNLWFAATRLGSSPGNIFSIVTYSFEFLESSVALPAAFQSLTRLREITERINDSDQMASVEVDAPKAP